MQVVVIPKTMDNDVPGTDYCIGFSTCVTRTIELSNSLRTVAGSHERLVVLKNGRYDNIPINIGTSTKKNVNVDLFYNTYCLRPKFESFEMTPLFITTSDARGDITKIL